MKSSNNAVAGVGGVNFFTGDFGGDAAIVIHQTHGPYANHWLMRSERISANKKTRQRINEH